MDRIAISYDKLASVYDLSGRLVFSGSLVKSQVEVLNNYCGKRVLIVGAGTGKVLENFEANSFKEIDLIDISESMRDKFYKLDISKSPNVNYNLTNGKEYDGSNEYDLIMFPFFLDHFLEDEIGNIMEHYNSNFLPSTDIAIIDFVPPTKLRHKILSKLMLLFFRLTIGLDLKKIPNIFKVSDQILNNRVKEESFYFGKFIKSTIYSRL